MAAAAEAFLAGGGALTPTGVLTAVLAVATVMLVTRVLSALFPGSKPPISEGVPYIGGLFKFAKVRGR
jgi:small-conductance mechanosensitive channel